jgi:hypothetical protein
MKKKVIENFVTRITRSRVVVEMIWQFEFSRTKLEFWKVLGADLKI